ncbi:MAG: type I-E CRISPR-associated protein Cse1/CasA [Chloroflexi bacterium]|nr:type I-E CRISPR-associated protein Cse1/CasA [Chloroflexota bacterium]
MTYSFNLIDEPWIPCVHPDGRVEELGLRQTLLRAHELRGVQGDSPLETAALYRLLLAVLHSALRGPRTWEAWGELWEAGRWPPEVVNGYLDQWRERFDLFHPQRPFYQAGDDRVKPKSIASLVLDMVSGNNAVLFDHHTEETGVTLTPAKAARTVVVAQTFGLAGLSGIPGQAFTDAPWARGIVFLVESDDLFRVLMLNLMKYPDEKLNNMRSSKDDRPAWEQDDPYQPNRQVPQGYLDYLTWQNRRVLLVPEGDEKSPTVSAMSVAPALRLDASVFDPFKLYRKGQGKDNKEIWLITRFSEDRALWRDSDSFFGLKGERGKPPQTFYALASLVGERLIPHQQKFRFMALGMANDQAKVEFFQENHLPLPLEYLEDENLVVKLNNVIQKAEQTYFALKVAAQWLAALVLSPNSDGKKWQEIDRITREQAGSLMLHWNVDRIYWQRLELPFLSLLEDLPHNSEAVDSWHETLRQAAWEALEQAAEAAGDDPSALKAAVRVRAMLGYSLKNLLSGEAN